MLTSSLLERIQYLFVIELTVRQFSFIRWRIQGYEKQRIILDNHVRSAIMSECQIISQFYQFSVQESLEKRARISSHTVLPIFSYQVSIHQFEVLVPVVLFLSSTIYRFGIAVNYLSKNLPCFRCSGLSR